MDEREEREEDENATPRQKRPRSQHGSGKRSNRVLSPAQNEELVEQLAPAIISRLMPTLAGDVTPPDLLTAFMQLAARSNNNQDSTPRALFPPN
jgi:hypothetical protein